MAVEFDHLFICTDVGGRVGNRLVSFGLLEGSSRVHHGQGTTNRCFFFHNAMLELLWVHDPQEAQSEAIQRTRLWERWRDRQNGACPFGICLRVEPDSSDRAAFPSWDYHPPYLPPTLSIAVGTNSDVLAEPMLFQTPFGKRPDQFPMEKAQPIEHPVGFKEITRVEIVSPAANQLSPELAAEIATNSIKIRLGTHYRIEIGFDGETQEQQVDFQPELPLIISW